MSQLGFNDIIRKFPKAARRFLREGVQLAQKEFKANFDGEKNSESGHDWDSTVRPNPPKILDVEGNLKDSTLNGIPIISVNSAVLIIDPIDDRGRGYAAYHQESPSLGRNVQREFVTQSNSLTDKQEQLLIKILDQTFS